MCSFRQLRLHAVAAHQCCAPVLPLLLCSLPSSLPFFPPTQLFCCPAPHALRPPPPSCRCVPDVAEPRLQRLPDPVPGTSLGFVAGAGSGVHCMAVIPPSVSSSGALEVGG